jgi:hypothetical protein
VRLKVELRPQVEKELRDELTPIIEADVRSKLASASIQSAGLADTSHPKSPTRQPTTPIRIVQPQSQPDLQSHPQPLPVSDREDSVRSVTPPQTRSESSPSKEKLDEARFFIVRLTMQYFSSNGSFDAEEIAKRIIAGLCECLSPEAADARKGFNPLSSRTSNAQSAAAAVSEALRSSLSRAEVAALDPSPPPFSVRVTPKHAVPNVDGPSPSKYTETLRRVFPQEKPRKSVKWSEDVVSPTPAPPPDLQRGDRRQPPIGRPPILQKGESTDADEDMVASTFDISNSLVGVVGR